MRYRLLALDMDGTVLDDEKKISDKNRWWIERAIEEGVTVIFATARIIQQVTPYIEEMEIKAPIVTANGAEIWSEPGKLLSQTFMPYEDVLLIKKASEQHHVNFMVLGTEGLFDAESMPHDSEHMQWFQCWLYSDHIADLKKLSMVLQSYSQFEVMNSAPDNLEITPKGVTKAQAIEKVCDLLGVTLEQTAAAGDGLNDVQMLRRVGLGAAMGNAQSIVKEAADIIIPRNTEDGIAHLIQHYVLKGDE